MIVLIPFPHYIILYPHMYCMYITFIGGFPKMGVPPLIHPFDLGISHEIKWYHLVMTNSLPWKIHPFFSSVNHLF